MSLDEQQLRTVVLAQAIETADPGGKLVSAAERERAGNSALEAVRLAAELPGNRLEQVLHLRAREVVRLARRAAPSLEWLETPRVPLGWLMAGVPLAALLSGIATDRIANPHRVDLLSLPLLVILGWNLLVYAWLVLAAWRQRATPAAAQDDSGPGLVPDLRRRWARWRMRRGGPAADVTAAFVAQWHGLTAGLHARRFARVLHLAAAAWAAGIALSLLARGLVVQYEAGWESTFLEARHVHAILEVLFWPLAALFPLAPFSIEEVAALRDFAVRGQTGARWVYLYAGLLALLVIVPRLALAGWALWRERTLLRGLKLDLQQTYYQDLAARLSPARIVIGILAEDRQQRTTLLRILRRHGLAGPSDLLVTTAEGDELRINTDPEAPFAVDLVLLLAGIAPTLPEPWQGRPVVTLKLKKFAASWIQEKRLFDALQPVLPRASGLGFARLRLAWEEQNLARFREAMSVLAAHLLESERALDDRDVAMEALPASQARGFTRLLELHRMDRTAGDAVEERLYENFAPPSVTSKTQAGMTGAAAGAALGASLDALTAFMSLGAASAIGALVGGGLGLARSAWQHKDINDGVLQGLVEAALLRYLAIEHFSRIGAAEGAIDPAWRSEVVAAVAAQWKTLGPIFSMARKPEGLATAPAELSLALQTLTSGVLTRVYLPADN